MNAGASLGLKDSDAGSSIEEFEGSGWSSSIGVGVGVTVTEVEHGVLEYATLEEGSGSPGSAVKAGAWLGLNDRVAGSWIDELYGSG